MNSVFQVIICSLGAVIVLFIMTKLIGNKQISQLNLFDYINGITIGSIGAELAIYPEKDFYIPLIAISIFTASTVIINIISSKSLKFRRILEGRSVILMSNGKIYKENLKKAKLDLNEFLVQCRVAGYYDLCDIDTAILESNGKVSILPTETTRPVCPEDMGMSPKQSLVKSNVIIDGHVVEGNLHHLGFNREWLNKKLQSNNIRLEEVYLASADRDGTIDFYDINAQTATDPFQ